MRQNMAATYAEESKQVEFLAEKYQKLGRSKMEAQQMAIATSKKMLKADLAEVQSQLASATTDEQKRIAQLRLADLGGRGQALEELSKQSMGNKLAPGASSAGAAKGTSSTSSGSSTEFSGARPQSVIINIHDGLVKNMNITAQTIKESAVKIREEVTKALLETANDANTIGMAQ